MQPSSRKQESRFDKPGPIVTPEVELYSNPRFLFAEPVTPEIISLIELNSERRFGDWSNKNSIFLPTWIDSGVKSIRLHLKNKCKKVALTSLDRVRPPKHDLRRV